MTQVLRSFAVQGSWPYRLPLFCAQLVQGNSSNLRRLLDIVDPKLYTIGGPTPILGDNKPLNP
jgi:hypothetical protein